MHFYKLFHRLFTAYYWLVYTEIVQFRTEILNSLLTTSISFKFLKLSQKPQRIKKIYFKKHLILLFSTLEGGVFNKI